MAFGAKRPSWANMKTCFTKYKTRPIVECELPEVITPHPLLNIQQASLFSWRGLEMYVNLVRLTASNGPITSHLKSHISDIWNHGCLTPSNVYLLRGIHLRAGNTDSLWLRLFEFFFLTDKIEALIAPKNGRSVYLFYVSNSTRQADIYISIAPFLIPSGALSKPVVEAL